MRIIVWAFYRLGIIHNNKLCKNSYDMNIWYFLHSKDEVAVLCSWVPARCSNKTRHVVTSVETASRWYNFIAGARDDYCQAVSSTATEDWCRFMRERYVFAKKKAMLAVSPMTVGFGRNIEGEERVFKFGAWSASGDTTPHCPAVRCSRVYNYIGRTTKLCWVGISRLPAPNS